MTVKLTLHAFLTSGRLIMKFLISSGGKNVFLDSKLICIDEGEFETKDKELQVKLKNCKGVSEVKTKKA